MDTARIGSGVPPRPDEFTPAVSTEEYDEVALCYRDTVKATGIDPTADWKNKIEPVTKRSRHRAGRLTGRVWDALETDPMADTSALTADTVETPVVVTS